MLPLYEETGDHLRIYRRKPRHVAPHLHTSAEFVYLVKGSLALGVGQELYPMEEGDFAVIFPGFIHHFQNFFGDGGLVYHLLASPELCGKYNNKLQGVRPQNPVILKDNLHEDIVYVMKRLMHEEVSPEQDAIDLAYVQLLFARSLPLLSLVPRTDDSDSDLVYRCVTYIAARFQEPVTLTSMAHDLGVSPYALSRIFSGTFHMNFKRFLNETRLSYACALLEETDQSVTEICYNAGFESQRTFNRVFKESYHMSPREFRDSVIKQPDRTVP